MALNNARLVDQLGHLFRDEDLLRLALTHASQGGSGADNSNERLEFLGDRVLGLVIAELVFEEFPSEPEGALARRHTALVCGEALARVAGNIGLGDCLVLSDGEDGAGGRENPSILADAMEAIIAALYIDGGLDAAKAFIRRHWMALLNEDIRPPKDAKTRLQEWAQARGLALPAYEETNRSGPAHAPDFEITLTVDGLPAQSAKATSKRAGEKKAAELMLSVIEQNGSPSDD